MNARFLPRRDGIAAALRVIVARVSHGIALRDRRHPKEESGAAHRHRADALAEENRGPARKADRVVVSAV